MDMNEWRKRFQSNLRFWSLQCTTNALPGFCAAMWLFGLSKNALAPVAMLLALFTFILALASLGSASGNLLGWKTLPSRGLLLGLRLRGICVVASLMVLIPTLAANGSGGNPMLMLLPDIWIGLGAVLGAGLLSEPFGFGNPATHVMDGGSDLGFFTIYLITLFHGLILCFLIFILSFVAMLIMQMRDRRRLYPTRSGGRIEVDDRSCLRGDS